MSLCFKFKHEFLNGISNKLNSGGWKTFQINFRIGIKASFGELS